MPQRWDIYFEGRFMVQFPSFLQFVMPLPFKTITFLEATCIFLSFFLF